mmetsp:Transcript_35686/g.83525  ORF Transcript_35686/g.83525 Transcript_35686/m.83525 type:complete len:741 (+) Transcript_35686:98-2320(+)
MRFVKGLLGGKGNVSNDAEALLDALGSGNVPDNIWKQSLAVEKLEEALEHIPGSTFHALCSQNAGGVLDLLQRAVIEIERCLSLEELSDDDDQALSNVILIATRFLASMPEAAKAAASPLADLWTKPAAVEGAAPLGHRFIDAAVAVLFKETFTIDLKSEKAGKGKVAAPEPDTVSAPSGVDVPRLWATGVGVASAKGVGQGDPDDDTIANRQLGLQLLLAAVCGSVPARKGASKPATAKAKAAAQVAAPEVAEGDAAPRGCLEDYRGLSYLIDPAAPVPRRQELFYSLLSTAFDYDPVGTGVPYAGYFAEPSNEIFVHLCLQVLNVLLLDPSDFEVTSGIVARRPQEEILQGAASSSSSSSSASNNFFRTLLQNVSAEAEVNFIFDGLLNITSTVVDQKRTYLPRSMKVPPFLPEMLVFMTHLVACRGFLLGIAAHEDLNSFVSILVHMMFEVPAFLPEDSAAMLAASSLLQLTSCPEILAKLDDRVEDDLPKELPKLSTHLADMVALAVLKQASDKIGSAVTSPSHRCLVQFCFGSVANVTPFCNGLSQQTGVRLFASLERCAKAVQAKRGSSVMLDSVALIVESVVNAVQYRYGQNLDLAYGLVSRKDFVKELHTCMKGRVQEEGMPEEEASCVRDIVRYLEPASALLAQILPRFEAQVEAKGISNHEEAKKLLPQCVQHMLPTPHAFALRSVLPNAWLAQAAEAFLVRCLAEGPGGDVWEWEPTNGDSGAPAQGGN